VRNRLQNNLSYKMYEFIMCVTSYIICNNEGLVLRRMSSMTQEEADKLAQVNPFCQLFFFHRTRFYQQQHSLPKQHMFQLTTRAGCLVRDTNPKDELRHLRIRTKQKELIITHNKEFVIVVIQLWTPYNP
jgi:hypothetical protein